MFPTISHINDLLPFIDNNPNFRVAKQDNGCSVVCYMLQDGDTFTGEYEKWFKECRGITFHENGAIASRTLHKFFNVGESELTLAENIPWDNIARITDKRDGSMITFVLLPDGSIIGKTKKTFSSAEALAATEFLHKCPRKLGWVKTALMNGLTPSFEWTSPKFPIVLLYLQDELTLLQVRNNVTGEYVRVSELDTVVASACPFPILPNQIDKINDARKLLELAKTTNNIEGWIIQDDVGNAWKIKTDWYCKLHSSIVFTRWRDIAKSVLAEQSDDLKAAFKMSGRNISSILKVENEITKTILTTKQICEKTIMEWNGVTAKQFAVTHNDHPHFSLLMMLFNKKEPKWHDWYKKNYLNTWSLEVVGIN